MTLTPDARIHSLYPTFTNSEKKIADYLLSQLETDYLLNVTLEQLAVDIGTGQASIIRFIKKCGSSSYRDFMSDLARAQYNNLIRSKFLEYTNENALYQNVASHLASCVDNLSDEDLDQAASYLEECSLAVCCGVGYSDCMALLAWHRLMHNNILAIHNDREQMYMLNPYMLDPDQNVLMLMFSVSGETESIVSMTRKYRARENTRIIAFTSHVESSLARLADVTFYAPSSDEHHPSTVRGIDGIINMIFLMDAVLNRYFGRQAQEGKTITEPVSSDEDLG